MKTKNLILLLFSVLTMIACEKNEKKYGKGSEEIIGYWVYSSTSDSIITYERKDSLEINNYGFAFKSGQIFIERKNSGWCGTPPISYSDFEGTWTKTDSIIMITVGYWGGTVDYKWKFISVDDEKLRIIRLSEY